MKKSSKRSAARRRQRQPEPPTFYVDECLGRGIALTLQSHGHDAQPFDEFAGRSDVEMLLALGSRNWVLLTKDKNIRKNELEVDAILNSGIRAFVVTATNLNHPEITALITGAMKKILKICRQKGPFVYNVTASGTVSQVPRRVLRRGRRRDR